jgi:NADH-quinone oxidoreductase subunit L
VSAGVSLGTVLLPAIVIGPALVGALLILVRTRLVAATAGWVGAVTVGLAAVASVVPAVGGATASTDFMLGAELGVTTSGPAAVILPVILAVAALVLLAATATTETREARFTGLMLLFTAAAALTVLATSLPTLLLGWEVMGAASYALIGYRYADRRRVGSGATAFLTTRAADLGLYLATAAALAGGTDLSLSSLASIEGGWRDVAAAGILVAALGKAAQLPFSFWLARAMDGPSPVSSLLHSAAMVALGGYLLLQVSPLLAATGWADDAAAWTGAATAVVLGAVALAQTDLKQLLAASTAAQLGFVVLAAGVGATSAGTAHLVAHAAVKALLFLAAGAWLEALGSKRLSTLTGAARRWPALGLLAAVALLSLAGMPPLALWATKDAVLAGSLEHSLALYVVGLLGSAMAAGYAVKALVILVSHQPDVAPHLDEEEPGTRTVSPRATFALVPLGLGAVALGLLAWPPVLESLPGDAPLAPAAWELAASTAVVVVVGALVASLVRRPSRADGRQRGVGARLVSWLHSWLGLEALVAAMVVRPVLRAADAAARLDDRVLARGVDLAAAVALRLAAATARLDDGFLARGVDRFSTGTLQAAHTTARGDAGLSATVSGVALGARRAGRLVRRSSASGQLHVYYLQLVAGVLLTAVVLTVILLVGSPR